jgi:hypothetical protein
MGILVLLLSCSSSPKEEGGDSAETTDQPSVTGQNCSGLPDIDPAGILEIVLLSTFYWIFLF